MLIAMISVYENSSNFYIFFTFSAFSKFLTKNMLKKIGKETIDAILITN